MKLVMRCPMCGGEHYIELTAEQEDKYRRYRGGEGYIQEMFAEFGAVDREFIKTGYCPQCQELLFGDGTSELIKKVEKGE